MARIKYYDSTSASWKYADTNITSTSSVELDTTLSMAGKAADAKAVGDAISQISGGNVELDTTLTQSGKAADAKAVGDALEGKQNAGIYAKTVNGISPDKNGNVKVNAFGDSWELIYYGEITEDVPGVIVDKDSNGNAFSLKEYKLVIKTASTSENQSNSFSWYSHNDDDGTAGPFYTIMGADGGKTLVFSGKLCGDCMYCQYISDSGNTSPQSMRNALVTNAIPVRKLNLYANSGNMCGAGTKIALFGVRAQSTL